MFLSLFVCASPCWFSAAVLHRTLCVWHKLSWTVPVKYKKFYTEIQKVLHKNTTNLEQKYQKNGTKIFVKRVFTQKFVCLAQIKLDSSGEILEVESIPPHTTNTFNNLIIRSRFFIR